MLNIRNALALGALLVAGTVACADRPSEGTGAARQRIDTVDADADADTDAQASPDAPDAANACAHALCAPGGTLDAACDPCATTLCSQDPYCCAVAWDLTCVGEVTSICAQSCVPDAGEADGGAGSCAHALCATGAALASTCDPCATTLCTMDTYCCTTAWDGTCVNEVGTICAQTCN